MEEQIYLLFDIGGTSVKYAAGDGAGQLWDPGSFKTPESGMEELLARMAEVYRRFEGRRNICGAAVSCPGAVDGTSGVIHGSSAVPYIHEISFRDLVSRALGGLSVLIENDARCFAMGEMWLGEAAGAGHFSTIAIGSGIGGAMVHDRQVLYGANLCCGEVSNFPLGGQRPDGTTEVWSDYTPVNLAKRYSCQFDVEINGKQLFELAEQGDETAAIYLDQFYYYTALGCILIQFSYDPEVIVLGGGVSEREDLARRIEEKVDDILCPGQNFSFLKPKLVRSRNNNRSNLRGALFALLQRVKEETNEGISV